MDGVRVTASDLADSRFDIASDIVDEARTRAANNPTELGGPLPLDISVGSWGPGVDVATVFRTTALQDELLADLREDPIGGDADLADGLVAAEAELNRSASPRSARSILVITDSTSTAVSAPLVETTDIPVHVVGFDVAPEAAFEQLASYAATTGGAFESGPIGQDAIERIGLSIVARDPIVGNDADDNDTLVNCEEEAGLITNVGDFGLAGGNTGTAFLKTIETYFSATTPYNSLALQPSGYDTDGDLVPDDVEMGVLVDLRDDPQIAETYAPFIDAGFPRLFNVRSNPGDPDSVLEGGPPLVFDAAVRAGMDRRLVDLEDLIADQSVMLDGEDLLIENLEAQETVLEALLGLSETGGILPVNQRARLANAGLGEVVEQSDQLLDAISQASYLLSSRETLLLNQIEAQSDRFRDTDLGASARSTALLTLQDLLIELTGSSADADDVRTLAGTRLSYFSAYRIFLLSDMSEPGASIDSPLDQYRRALDTAITYGAQELGSFTFDRLVNEETVIASELLDRIVATQDPFLPEEHTAAFQWLRNNACVIIPFDMLGSIPVAIDLDPTIPVQNQTSGRLDCVQNENFLPGLQRIRWIDQQAGLEAFPQDVGDELRLALAQIWDQVDNVDSIGLELLTNPDAAIDLSVTASDVADNASIRALGNRYTNMRPDDLDQFQENFVRVPLVNALPGFFLQDEDRDGIPSEAELEDFADALGEFGISTAVVDEIDRIIAEGNFDPTAFQQLEPILIGLGIVVGVAAPFTPLTATQVFLLEAALVSPIIAEAVIEGDTAGATTEALFLLFAVPSLGTVTDGLVRALSRSAPTGSFDELAEETGRLRIFAEWATGGNINRAELPSQFNNELRDLLDNTPIADRPAIFAANSDEITEDLLEEAIESGLPSADIENYIDGANNAIRRVIGEESPAALASIDEAQDLIDRLGDPARTIIRAGGADGVRAINGVISANGGQLGAVVDVFDVTRRLNIGFEAAGSTRAPEIWVGFVADNPESALAILQNDPDWVIAAANGNNTIFGHALAQRAVNRNYRAILPDDLFALTDEAANQTATLGRLDTLVEQAAEPDFIARANGHKATVDETFTRVDNPATGQHAPLRRNQTYIRSGYEYATDDFGRVANVIVDDLKLDPDFPSIEYTRTVGNLGNSGDDGGHLIARIFEGFSEGVNLVPMNSNLNRGAYARFEAGLAEALERGDSVQLQIQVIYDASNNTVRPDRFEIRWSLNGQPQPPQPFVNS